MSVEDHNAVHLPAANLRQIRAFQLVCQTGSVSRAAKVLGRTQPSITMLIKNFEEELGFQLFDRQNGKLFPTPEARYLLYKVDHALEALHSISATARDLREIKTGNVRIAAHPGMAFSLAPKILSGFLTASPNITAALDVRESRKVNEFIATGYHEIGLSDVPPEDPLVNAVVYSIRCVCVVPEGHKLESKPMLTPTDISGEPYIGMDTTIPLSAAVKVAFNGERAHLNTIVETHHFLTACIMVANGFGVSIVPPHAAYDYIGAGLVTCRFEPEILFDTYLLRPNSIKLSKAAQHLYDIFAEYLSALAVETKVL